VAELSIFFWRAYFKTKHILEWFFASPANAKTGAWTFFIIAFILFWIVSIYHTLNPFSIYRTTIQMSEAFKYDAYQKNLSKAREADDAQKIREALAACEKNANYRRIKKQPEIQNCTVQCLPKRLRRSPRSRRFQQSTQG